MDLLFGIHCHQPFNNFYEVVDEATDKSYLPFLNELLNFQNIKINIHYSGWLLQWLKTNREDTFKLLKKLNDNGQIEFFTSGFYEPILSVLPEKDAELQIIKSNAFIRNNFGKTPEGLWLTERVWEDKLIKILLNCGIKYVVVDDYHFFAAGLGKDDVYGYYLTEAEGEPIGIFPINKELRYLIPFNKVEEISDFLDKIPCGIIFDDGEKFGLWPETFEWVYEKNWLKKFFTLINNSKKITTMKFSEFFYNKKPIGRIYLPEVSYHEMGEWALEYKNASILKKLIDKKSVPENLLRTGIWKNFFIKYEESNNIHKRMLDLSKTLHLGASNEYALEYLLQSQCNDCLWHGVFGGIYLPILRNNAYIAINKAENIIDNFTENSKQIILKDINLDGYNELILKNKFLTIIASSKFGGAVFEFSHRKTCFNIMNTLMRRKETYHDSIRDLAKKDKNKKITTIHEMDFEISDELKDALIFDNHLKYSFLDKFFGRNETFSNYKKNNITELSDLTVKSFEIKKDNHICFSTKGNLTLFKKKFPLSVSKKYNLQKETFHAEIIIKNESFLTFDITYCVEMNFFFPGHNNTDSHIKAGKCKTALETEITIEKINRIVIYDAVMASNVLIESDKKFDLWSYPFYTVSKSEKGFEKIYQGTTFGFLFPFDFFPDEERNYCFKIGVI